MRFEVTQVLDAIERHLTTEAALAQAVVDLGEIAWFDALDGGRPVNLLRTGVMLDALARHLGEDAVMVYPVAGRDLLTDADLTSKERMVLGRWAGDGLIEVVQNVSGRAVEVADITGLPLVTRDGFPGLEGRYPWLRGAVRPGPAHGAGRRWRPHPRRRARLAQARWAGTGSARAGLGVPPARVPDLRRAARSRPRPCRACARAFRSARATTSR